MGVLNGAVEDIIKLAVLSVIVVFAGWLGWQQLVSLLGIQPPSEPAYDENVAQRPNGPFQFMPLVDFARTSLGIEAKWDPPIAPDSIAILYPKAISVQKLRGNVLRTFDKAYPGCINMDWGVVKAADGNSVVRETVTLRLGTLDGPSKRLGDPRTFYECRASSTKPSTVPSPAPQPSTTPAAKP